MRRNLLIVLAACAATGALTWWADYQSRPPLMPLPEVQVLPAIPAPDFAFAALDGSEYRLSTFRGKPVILNFWASWCAPCLVEFPKLIELAKREDLFWLAVSVDSDKAELDRFLERFPALPSNALVVWDKDKAIAQDLFQSIRYPETILIDTNQMMRRKVIGDTDWTGPEITNELRQLTQP